MYVNTSVIKALMQLRGVTEGALCSLCHVTISDLRAWLNEDGENSVERVEFDTQLEILKILGVHGNQPRGDVVHYWKIHESLFSKATANYWPLQVLLRTFGKAQASFITPEADPMLMFNAKAHFGLRFENFLAIVEVTAHPLRNISFDPANLAELEWVPDVIGVLLPEVEYTRLEPGAMKVRGLTQYLTYSTEVSQWEKLREKAIEQGIRADQVAALLLGNTSGAQLVSHSVKAAASPVDAVVKTPATPEPATVAPAAPIAVEATLSVADDLLLFQTPVKSAANATESGPHLKRVV